MFETDEELTNMTTRKTQITRALFTLALALVIGVAGLAITNPSERIETHVVIDAAPSEVWATLTDTARYGEWNPFIHRLEGELALGETLSVDIGAEGEEGMTFSPEVIAFEEGRELRWLGHLGVPRVFDGEHYFLVEATEDGRTRVTQGEVFHGVLIPFVGSVLDDTRDGFESMNDALRERVEAQSSTSRAAGRRQL